MLDPREEEQLRQLIRKELENREKLRSRSVPPLGDGDISEERRRVIEDEIADYYRSRGGYQAVTNEHGEVEWLTDAEAREREQQIPVDMEELEEGQRRVRLRIVVLCALFFVAVVLVFVAMREKTGSIQVISNVPDATIILDGASTEFQTDFKLENLPAGPHLISITKPGYVADGPASMRVDLEAGKNEVAALKLKPQTGR